MDKALSKFVADVAATNGKAVHQIKCRNRQCGRTIALINGDVSEVKCKCGHTRKLYHSEKSALKLTVKL